MYLPDHEHELFELCFLFAYAGKIFSTQVGDRADATNDQIWARLINAGAPGDYLRATSLRMRLWTLHWRRYALPAMAFRQ